jgi:UDP-N-acetylmuramate dehydrogenase
MRVCPVALRAAEAGLSGLEWACGIPGTVGGSVYMNAGVKEAEVKDSLRSALVLEPTGELREYTGAELDFTYRTSVLHRTRGVVLEAVFRLAPQPQERIYTAMNQFMAARKAGQPLHLPNCGSVFRNPPGDFAGRLIDAVGLKGFRLGGVMVSEQHANFIVNCGDGRAVDVIALIAHIREIVHRDFGIELEPELRFIR